MSKKTLPIGIEDFKKVKQNEYYYIDKTLLIKELLDMKGEVNLFTRPRRFGKTLNMSMLRYYFDIGENNQQEMFAGTHIMEAGEEYLSYMGKYPVISLSMKSMKQPTFELSMEQLKRMLKEEYERYWRFVKGSGILSDNDQERYEKILELKGETADYYIALKFLSECLSKCYGTKVFILIDEYDVPLENAYFTGFYDEMIALIRSLFESALKTNPNLEMAVITGCLRISKKSIFTGLNNLKIMSITSDSYSGYFGFTQKEVDEMLEYYGVFQNRELLEKWYDGYRFGETDVYNPWSVVNYVDSCLNKIDALPKPYWSNTSSNSIVKKLVERANLSAKQEIELLIEGKTIQKPIHEDITYEDMDSTQDNLWNFLFFTGYLKKIREWIEEETIYMEMAIPNSEVRYIYKTTILRWFDEYIKQKDLNVMFQSILDGDAETFQKELSARLRESISFYDSKETFYHGFLLGILGNMDEYLADSNRESGDGRYDICIRSLEVEKPAIVFELKQADNYGDMETKSQIALQQIQKKHYGEHLKEEGYQELIYYKIAFYKKNCKVKMARKVLE